MPNPKVSIVLPTYNRVHYLPETIDSIFLQAKFNKKTETAVWKSFTDWELIIVDDGSTDGTDQYLSWLKEQDRRVKVISLPKNEGIARARNAGCQAAQGTYIAVMDSDDWMARDRLDWSVKRLDKGDCDIVYGAYHVTLPNGQFNQDDIMVPPKVISRDGLIKEQGVPHVTIMAKRKCFLDHPYLSEFTSNDDYPLVVNWFLAGYTFAYIDRSLCAVRIHDQSVTHLKRAFNDEVSEKVRAELRRTETA